jgi:hypothetical protein
MAMRVISLCCAVVLISLGFDAAAAGSAEKASPAAWRISAEQWAHPRSGAKVAKLPAVRQAVSAWTKHPNRHIVILYRGGETGTFHATELRDWLVALGVSSAHIELQPAGGPADELRLEVE